MLQTSYQYYLSKDTDWPKSIKQELATVGLYELFINNHDNEIPAEITICRRLVDIFGQSAFANVSNCNSKLSKLTYSMMKTKIYVQL